MIVAFGVPRLPRHFDGLAKGRYIDQLLEGLGRCGPEHRFIRYEPETEGDSEEQRRTELDRFLTQQGVDLFVAVEPYRSGEVRYRKEWFGGVKAAVLLMDRFPSRSRRDDGAADVKSAPDKGLADFVRGCDLVLTVSEALRREIVRSAGIPANKIVVVPGGIDEHLSPIAERAAPVMEAGSAADPRKRYVLCAGSELADRQGEALFAAFAAATRELNDPCTLVVAEGEEEEDRLRLLALAETAGVRDRIEWACPLDAEELARLYVDAELFAFAGEEGALALPIAEAMACGTPVIAHDRAQWNEVGDEAIYRTDMYDDQRLRLLLGQLLGGASDPLKSARVAKGSRQARKYEWQACAEKTLRALSDLCRKRIAIVVAGRSSRSGLASRLPLLLPTLTEHYDCDVYGGKAYDAIMRGVPGNRVVRYAMEQFQDRAGDYEETIYLVDLLMLDELVSELMRQYPGIVLVDDEEAEPERGRIDRLLDAARGTVVVHRAETARLLEELGFPRVVLCRKPFKLPVMVTAIVERDFTFASSGRIGPGDGLEEAMASIRHLVDSGRDNVRLWASGELDSEYAARLRELAEALAIQDRVELLGPLEENEFGVRMSRSDVCLILREPPSGELPDELLEALSYGKPTVVLEAGANRELPDDAVRKMAPGAGERESLFETMAHLYDDAELRKKLRKQARAYISANHSPPRYASSVLSLLEGRDIRSDAEAEAVTAPEEPHPGGEVSAAEVEPEAWPAEAAVTAATAAAEVPLTAGTLTLAPNRLRRIRKGKAVRCYFSFDLTSLPPGVSIRSAVMHIPARGQSLHVHRISMDWTVEAAAVRKPRVRPRPIHRSVRKRTRRMSVFRWDCTQLASKWLSGALNNYGLYAPGVSAVQKPWLSVEYEREGEVT